MRPLVPVLVVLLLVAGCAGTAASQEATNATGDDESDLEAALTEVVDGGEADDDPPQDIDENTKLVRSGIGDDGRAILVFESAKAQKLVLTDSAAALNGGEVPRETVYIGSGRSTVRFPVTKVNGKAAVGIDTGDVLWSEPLSTSDPLIGGPWGVTDVQLGVFGGAVWSMVSTFLVAYFTLRGRGTEARRVL